MFLNIILRKNTKLYAIRYNLPLNIYFICIRTNIKLDIEHFEAEYDLESMKCVHEYIKNRDNTIFKLVR